VHQKPVHAGRNAGGRGEAAPEAVRDEARTGRHETGSPGRDDLLAQALAKANMEAAWKRVKSNRGSAGGDGLSIAETADYLRTHWPRIRASLLDGSYRPLPVRRVQIPKPDGGVRELGIPAVTDRLIQQALLQVLQPRIDPTFSDHSYGFRPGRRAHDAVLDARRYVQDGYRVVVDVDLEKFFDRVNHDILMERLARRIADKAVLRCGFRPIVTADSEKGVTGDSGGVTGDSDLIVTDLGDRRNGRSRCRNRRSRSNRNGRCGPSVATTFVAATLARFCAERGDAGGADCHAQDQGAVAAQVRLRAVA
jgi:hypothetical protein